MFKNYLLIAFRNIARNSIYSVINIAGLAVGIACSILIMLWVVDEVSYDSFHANQKRLSQVWINATYDGKVNTFQSVPLPTYQELKTTDNRIKNTCITNWGGRSLISYGEKRMNKKSYYVSKEFLEMFQFPLVKGNAHQVLADANSIVLTESAARSFFGNEDPVGKIVKLENQSELKVTGVLADVPSNSSFEIEALIPIIKIGDWFTKNENEWGDYSWQVFVELQNEKQFDEVNEAIKDLLVKKGQTDVPRSFFLHPLEKWRLESNFENGKISGGVIDYVKGFTIISVFILTIACINFMNLATARSERRAREVGVRKSVGSRRSELIIQFLGESILITAIGFVVAIFIVELTLPFYNNFTEKQLSLNFSSPIFWLTSFGLVVLTGFISGSYPALYLSAFNPIEVLKSKMHTSKKGATPRKTLVVIQFIFSTFLIVGTLVITQQISYVRQRSVGYERENLITIPFNSEIEKNFKTIRQELINTGAVVSVTQSNSPITNIYSNNFIDWPGKAETEKVLFTTIATELDYVKTMGMKLLEGRDFMDDRDTASVLINQAAVEVMGMKETLGQEISFWGDRKAKIVGIVNNVVMGSPFQNIKPMFVIYNKNWASDMTIRLEKTTDTNASIKKIEAVLKKLNPSYPFEYTFVDQEFEKKYSTINLIGTLAKLFAFLAIFITGLGLFGLAAFTAEQRTKEIGIRKVMGASVTSLVGLIAKEFSILVTIGFVIASPFAWWFMKNFLEKYAYRIDFPWWALAASGLAALVFALIIVSIQALKAAATNPSQSLRSE
jgi:predicted permease